jgi:hypothetical protein
METENLTKAQITHAVQCLNLFNKTALDKYHKGQIHWGGNMWEKPSMLTQAYEEVIDQMFYISTIANQVDLALKFLNEGHIDKAKNILANLTLPIK